MAKSSKAKQQPDLYDVALSFVGHPRKCLRNQAARDVIREYDLDWDALVQGLRFGQDAKEQRMAERFADRLAGFRLVRDMESKLKGVQHGTERLEKLRLKKLQDAGNPTSGPLSLGRGFRKKVPIRDGNGKEIGMTRIQDILGNPDFTQGVTARLKTRLLAEMYEDLDTPKYEKWWVREVLQETWKLVGESLEQESISRVLRRFRKRQHK